MLSVEIAIYLSRSADLIFGIVEPCATLDMPVHLSMSLIPGPLMVIGWLSVPE